MGSVNGMVRDAIDELRDDLKNGNTLFVDELPMMNHGMHSFQPKHGTSRMVATWIIALADRIDRLEAKLDGK